VEKKKIVIQSLKEKGGVRRPREKGKIWEKKGGEFVLSGLRVHQKG